MLAFPDKIFHNLSFLFLNEIGDNMCQSKWNRLILVGTLTVWVFKIVNPMYLNTVIYFRLFYCWFFCITGFSEKHNQQDGLLQIANQFQMFTCPGNVVFLSSLFVIICGLFELMQTYADFYCFFFFLLYCLESRYEVQFMNFVV